MYPNPNSLEPPLGPREFRRQKSKAGRNNNERWPRKENQRHANKNHDDARDRHNDSPNSTETLRMNGCFEMFHQLLTFIRSSIPYWAIGRCLIGKPLSE